MCLRTYVRTYILACHVYNSDHTVMLPEYHKCFDTVNKETAAARNLCLIICGEAKIWKMKIFS
jgi:hypothetical protein